MKQKIIVFITLVAFWLQIFGCGGMKNVKFFGDEIQKNEDVKNAYLGGGTV